MPMQDWRPTNAMENLTGNWVYYVCTAVNAFANIHFSRHVDNSAEDHMATNDGAYYYYGVTGTFNQAAQHADQSIRQALYDAWQDYFKVQ
ncbi:hypothetical protein [Streptomyces chattanoogensis]|uniref:hypothetical protein n=1 Tax=Streptomyces chattanoogensis TaxID=66876 RepID=UPI0005D91ACA|nr:hypothetical protein T261_4732 [Streptomyces lydicus]